jgi:uncharacterized protein YjbI with pentapeptide repeats
LTIGFEKPTTHRNWSKLAKYIAKAIAKAHAQDLLGTIWEVEGGIVEVIGNPTDSTKNQAWVWLNATLASALMLELSNPRHRSELNSQDIEKKVKDFLDQHLPSEGQFLAVHFENVNLHPVSIRIHEDYETLLNSIAPSRLQTPKQSIYELRKSIKQAAVAVYAQRPDAFKKLKDAATAPSHGELKREVAWERHSKWIQKHFISDPIFSLEEDERTPLSAVYVKPRAFWNGKIVHTEAGGSPKDETEFHTANIVDLHAHLHDWLDDENGEPIRLVAGGPGSGKSAFSRAFSYEVLDRQEFRVVYTHLQRLNFVGADLYQTLGENLRRNNDDVDIKGSEGFYENPLDWRSSDQLPILIVFDGLDELSPSEETSSDLARKLVQTAGNLVNQYSRANARIRVLILGRDVACESALSFVNLPSNALLRIAPMDPLERSDLNLPNQSTPKIFESADILEIIDPQRLCDLDLREKYWLNWSQAKGECSDIPESFKAEALGDLTVEPLLLHLLIISGFAGEKWKLAAENRNRIYEKIFRDIHARNQAKLDGRLKSVTAEVFFSLMETLGLAAWRGNGRTGDADDFNELRILHMGERSIRKLGVNSEVSALENVAMQIHTRQGYAEKGFEFIHKSFGEYLAGRALISAGVRNSEMSEADIGVNELASRWTKLIAAGELSGPIITFMKNEAKLRYDVLGGEKLCQYSDDLSEVINWVYMNGFPVHQVHSERIFRRLEDLQRCAEAASVAVASAFSSASRIEGHLVRIRPTHDFTFGVAHIFSRLSAGGDASVFQAFENLRLTQVYMIGQSFSGSNFAGCDLSKSSLIRVIFQSTDLQGINFSDCLFSSVRILGANLMCSNFARVSMNAGRISSADASGANFEDSQFRSSQLANVNLTRACLTNANFERAYFDAVDFSEANLKGINLKFSTLRGVDFSGADLSNCDLTGASVRSTNLSGALNVTQEMLDSTFGVKSGSGLCSIPDHLSYPAHWYDGIDPEDTGMDIGSIEYRMRLARWRLDAS